MHKRPTLTGRPISECPRSHGGASSQSRGRTSSPALPACGSRPLRDVSLRRRRRARASARRSPTPAVKLRRLMCAPLSPRDGPRDAYLLRRRLIRKADGASGTAALLPAKFNLASLSICRRKRIKGIRRRTKPRDKHDARTPEDGSTSTAAYRTTRQLARLTAGSGGLVRDNLSTNGWCSPIRPEWPLSNRLSVNAIPLCSGISPMMYEDTFPDSKNGTVTRANLAFARNEISLQIRSHNAHTSYQRQSQDIV